jgi:trigger factor
MESHPEETMKKRLLLLLTTVCLMIPCLAGCGKKDELVLGKYKGLTYPNKTFEVSEEDFQNLYAQILERYTTYESIESRKGTAVKKGDLVKIDFSGVLDGQTEPFEGGTGKDSILEIGSGRFIPGFEDGLIGVKQGETTDLKLTFPEQYYAEYAGKKVTFTVTVKDIVEKKVREMNDELITDYSNGQFKTLEEYKKFASDYIIQAKAQTYMSQVRSDLLDKIVSDTKFGKLDAEKLDGYYNDIKNYYANEALKANMSLENYLSATYNTTVDEFNAQVKGVAEQTMKEEMVLNAIVSKEKIVLSDEQYNTMVQEYMKKYDYTDQAKFETEYGKDKLRQSMLFDLAFKVIMDSAVAE